MNRSDSERIAAILEKTGYKLTSKINEADLVVVNMCSVRQSAVNRVYGLIQKFQKLKIVNCKLKIVLTGCVLKKDKIKLNNYFDFIISIKDIIKLPRILNKKIKFNTKNYLSIKPVCSTDFTAFVPIMTGCNNFCTYCVVPYIRGREVSRPAKEIICEVKNLVKRGYKEIWLLGQNVNSYKNKNINFPKLLKSVNDIPGKFWIRFTSSHPKDFSDELINIMAKSKKYGRYLNLPVQAGDDKVLKKMNRPYTIAQYKNLVKKIRDRIPGISLSTDIIVGFPGETKKQFGNSVKLFKEIKYDMAYIAEYSPRPGTTSAKMEDNIPKEEKIRQRRILTEVLKKTALEKNKRYIGKTVEVLIDEKKRNNSWIGKTKEYKTIEVESDKNLLGRIIRAKVIKALVWGLKGRLK